MHGICTKSIDQRRTPERHEFRKRHAKKVAEKRFKERWENPIPWFFSKTEKRGDCIEWTGCCYPSGYGKTKLAGKQYATHRLSWILHNGEIPKEMMVCHKCDNRKCCNPDHLFIGSHQDNMDDGKSKLRFAKLSGELHGAHKLTNKSINSIRQKRSDGWTQKEIADDFGINQSTVSRILNKKRWKHI